MPTIVTCPKCGEKFSVDEALSHQFEEQVRSKLATEQKGQVAELVKKEQEKLAADLADKEAQIKELQAKEAKAVAEELKLRAEKRAIEDERKNFELEKVRQLDLERNKIREETEKVVLEKEKYKFEEKEQVIAALKRNIEEMQRKASQGSQQLQGEVLELEIEELLRRTFPTDEVFAIAKGVNGADMRHLVRGRSGALAGTIIWETKRTKNWTEGWVQKLKDDQRAEKADLAVLVTTVLPKELKTFGVHQGIWVSDVASVAGLALALRLSLLQVAVVKQSSVGKNEKMEVLYNYLSGVEFKQKIEAIVESFTGMKQDLDKEKLAYRKIWEKREKQIEQVVHNTVGLYGDLEGLMGKALPRIEQLELPE